MWSRLFCCGKRKKQSLLIVEETDNQQQQERLLGEPDTDANQSNCLTNSLIRANIFGEFLTLPMNAVDIAMLYDLIDDQDNKDWYGFSKGAVITAAALSTYLLASSAYLHYVLNKNHLDDHGAPNTHTHGLSVWQKIKNISLPQQVALLGHTLDHAFAIAAGIVFTVELVESRAHFHLANNIKIMIQAAGFVIGNICTLAESGTGLEALNIHNERQARRAGL